MKPTGATGAISGKVKRENGRSERGSALIKKITEAKGEARGTTFTGFMSYNRLDRGIPRGLSVSGTIVLYIDLCRLAAPTSRARVASQNVNVP